MCQGDLMRKKVFLEKFMLDINIRKINKHQLLPHNIYKNKPEMDQRPKCKI